jgi:peptidoglycan/LPS O-acetylase OafA/YrhL
MDLRVLHSSRLNFLRGIAVLLVVSVHSSQIIGNGDPASEWVIPISKNFFDFGARGVQIFFVLSAFGLAKSYEVHSVQPIRSYYTRRLFRIYPVWIAAVLIHALIENKTQVVFQNVTFAFGWLRGSQNNPEIVGGSWTLFVEVIFYILFPLIFPIVRHTKTLFILFVLLITLRIVWLKLAEEIFGIADRNSFIGLHPFTNFYCFSLGLLIYNQIKASRGNRMTFTPVIILLLAISIILEMDQILQVLLIGLLIYSFLEKTQIRSDSFFTPASKLIEYFGKYAFTIYLYHLLILKEGSSFLIKATEKVPYMELKFLVSMPIILVFLFTVGHLGYEYLEKPSIRIGKAFSSKFLKPKGSTHA